MKTDMKSIMATASLLIAGAVAGQALPPWQAPAAYELAEEVSVITITVPDANVQAHFACKRLVNSN